MFSHNYFICDSRTFCYRVGEASRPGPGFVLAICNITHLKNNVSIVKNLKFDALAVTEHSIVGQQVMEVRTLLGSNYKLHLSKLDKEYEHNTGGTGLVNNSAKHVKSIKPICSTLAGLIDQGRIGLYNVEVCANVFCAVYVLYCYTNGDCVSDARERTCDMLDVVYNDFNLQPDGPKLIVGDFNCSISNIPHISQEVAAGKLFDIGAIASTYGGTDCQNTCKAYNALDASRKDFVLANPAAERIIDKFEVLDSTGVSVHSVINVTFKGDVPIRKFSKIMLPKPIADFFKEKCLAVYGNANAAAAAAKRAIVKEGSKLFVCNVDVPHVVSPFPSSSKSVCNPTVSGLIHQDEEEHLKASEDALYTQDASSFTPAQTSEQLARLHDGMDAVLFAKADLFRSLLAKQDTEAYMTEYSQSIEDAVAIFCNLDADGYKSLMGRSTVNIREAYSDPPTGYNHDTNELQPALCKEGHRLLLQYRRLINIRNCSVKLNSPIRTLPGDKRQNLLQQLNSTLDVFLSNVLSGDDLMPLLEHIHLMRPSLMFNPSLLARHANHILDNFKLINKRQTKRIRQDNKAKLNGPRAHSLISRTLKASSPAPMTCLKRTEDAGPNKPKGSYTSCPKEIDNILRAARGNITNGNVRHLQDGAAEFICKYRKFCHNAPEWQIGDLDRDKFIKVCRTDKDSAAGLDGWAARDIALLSDHAIQLMTDLLNAIERGAPWPQHMLQTRAVFLSKDANSTDNPLAYRILKITSGWYRKWASCRNRELVD